MLRAVAMADTAALREELTEMVSAASSIGTATHRVIALCALLSSDPSYELIERTAKRRSTARRSSSGHQALVGAVTTMTASYFTHLFPAGARLYAIEERHHGVQFDLLWRLPDRTLFADELKTGRSRPEAYAAQATKQARVGREAFGARFSGVRVVSLRTTATAFTPAPERWSA